MSKWIPVSERLPKYGEVVLWSRADGAVFASAITSQISLPECSIEGSWICYVGKHGIISGRGNILAWQPLPQPYKEDEE